MKSNKKLIYSVLLLICLVAAGYFLYSAYFAGSTIDISPAASAEIQTDKYSGLRNISTDFLNNDKFKALKETVLPGDIKLFRGNKKPFGEANATKPKETEKE